MNREEIMTILPHREPMLLLDDVENREGTAIGHYTVRGDEFFLKGHFPDFPIVPGVILCEILAQTACVLMKDAMKEGELPVYTGLNNVRFRSPVKPGDTVETRCSIKRAKHPFYFAEGTVTAGGRKCVTAEFSFAITGAAITGTAVTESAVTGAAVSGAAVTGAAITGTALTGAAVSGASITGAAVTGA
jgi:3-hydroxyacyl-[acyl-carrier-protein] dehydratase